MTVVGTFQLQVIPQGSCIKYRLRAIVTSSMTCSIGLLGFPDLVALGLISREWVTKDHLCKAKVMVGALGLSKQCENSRAVRGNKRSNEGGENMMAKRLKLSETPPVISHPNSIKIFNIGKHEPIRV